MSNSQLLSPDELPDIELPTSDELVSTELSDNWLSFMQGLRQRGTDCDYIIVVGDETFPIHKCVMLACSDYFEALLNTDMVENKKQTLILEIFDVDTIKTILEFAYTAKIELKEDNKFLVLEAASYLQMPLLLKLVGNFIKSTISSKNCVDTHHIAHRYNLSECYEATQTFIYERIQEITATQTSKFSQTELKTILENDKLGYISELTLVNIVKTWMEMNKGINFDNILAIKHDEEPWILFTEFMALIRWPLIESDDLINRLDKSIKNAMYMIPKCLVYLIEAKDYHLFPLRQPFEQHVRTRSRGTISIASLKYERDNSRYGTSFYTITFNNLRKKNIRREKRLPITVSHGNDVRFASVNNFLFVCCREGNEKVFGDSFGGRRESDSKSKVVHLFRYDLRFESWKELQSMRYERDNYVLLYHDMKLYVIGGSVTHHTSIVIYSIADNHWHGGRRYPEDVINHSGCVVGDQIYISGGDDNSERGKRTFETTAMFLNPETDQTKVSSVKIPLLLKLVGNYLVSVINVENSADILKVAEFYSLTECIKETQKFIDEIKPAYVEDKTAQVTTS